MSVKEVITRYKSDSGYDYYYEHTPFEVVTPSSTVTNSNNTYNIPTLIPTEHYTRPIIIIFKAPSACFNGQKISVNGGTGIKITPGYRSDLVAGDIPANSSVVIYVDIAGNTASLISVNGAPVHASFFSNNYNTTNFPSNSQENDLMWNTISESVGNNGYFNSNVSIYSEGEAKNMWPATPNQIYTATNSSHTSKKYTIVLGDYPLTARPENARSNFLFMANSGTTASTGNDTITIDGIDYGTIYVGASTSKRGLFANEIPENTQCLFMVDKLKQVYVLFYGGKAGSGAGSTITLGTTPPSNPLSGDMFLQVTKVVS